MEYVTRLKNIELLDIPDPVVIAVLEQFFQTDIVSYGAITRKISALLLTLSRFTGKSWAAYSWVEESDWTAHTIVGYLKEECFTVYEESFRIDNKLRKKNNISNVFSMVDQMFTKDKWYNKPAELIDLLISEDSGTFRYIKKCLLDRPPGAQWAWPSFKVASCGRSLFSIKIYRTPTSLWRRICSYFCPTHNKITINQIQERTHGR